jgi:AcrR family transcriptional regulator
MCSKQSEKSEATRNKLIECSQQLFYRKGFDRTTVREIVKAAGVAQGTFYLYFETKDEVLLKILENASSAFNFYFNMLNVEDPCLEDIDRIIDYLVIRMKTHPELIKLIHNTRTIEITGHRRKKMEEDFFNSPVVEKWIANAGNKGLISKKPSQLYSRIILKIAHELLEDSFLNEHPAPVDIIKEEVKKIIKAILG